MTSQNTKCRSTLRDRARKSLPPQFSYEDLNESITPRPAQAKAQKLEAATAVKVHRTRNSTRQLLLQAIQRNTVLTFLKPADAEAFAGQLTCFEMGEMETLFDQGFPATSFYIVEQGKVLLRSNNRDIRYVQPGESLACTALSHNTHRSHTAVVLEECSFWACDKSIYDRYLTKAKSEVLQKVKKLCSGLPVLQGLSPQQVTQLLECAVPERYTIGERVVYEEESGTVLYFLLEGEAKVRGQGQELRKLGAGDFFGEQAVLYGGFRTATVTATSEILVLGVDKRHIFSVFSSHLDQFIYQNTMRIALEKSEHLRSLTALQRESIVDAIRIATYCYDEVVVQEGTKRGKTLYIVLNGSLRARSGLTVAGEKLAALYGCLGDDAVMQDTEEAYPYDVVADNDEVAVGELSQLDLEECICGDLEGWAAQGRISLRHFRGIPLLEDLHFPKQIAVSRAIVVKEFAPGEVIFEQDTPGEYLYILKCGSVRILKDGKCVRVVSKHDYFGEKAVLTGCSRTASVVAVEQCVCWLVDRDMANAMLDDMQKSRMVNRVERLDADVDMRDLRILRPLNTLRQGTLSLVQHSDGRFYCLKSVPRRVVKSDQEAWALTMERNVMMQIDHPYLLKLVTTMKDDGAVHFLTEYVKGQQLADVLRFVGTMSESDCRFYCAMLTTALCYLHERDIIHRDVKPENIIVLENGYIKLIEFASAKIVKGRTYSLVGTSHYMSPEVISRKGHNFACDLWSLGVTLFESLCGRLPFGEGETDPYLIFKRITEEELAFPPRLDCTSPCREFLRMLLARDPADRGCAQDLRQHQWLSSFDWVALSKGALSPSLRPHPEAAESADTATTSLDPQEPMDIDLTGGWDLEF